MDFEAKDWFCAGRFKSEMPLAAIFEDLPKLRAAILLLVAVPPLTHAASEESCLVSAADEGIGLTSKCAALQKLRIWSSFEALFKSV